MTPLARRCAGVAALATALFLLGTPSASATFHLIQVREVYPGSAAAPLAEYVELQMYESGQEFVGGHVLRTYGVDGSPMKANVLGSDVANGANQRTVLVATPEAEAQFGVQADAALAPSGQLDPKGGAVCWETLDCVAWGSFDSATLSPSGLPADPSGIPDGMALRRTIAPRCPTQLEAADDSDSSAADFSDVFPSPRPNSAVPAERSCAALPPGGGAGPEGGPVGTGPKRPQTELRRRPGRRIHDRTPTFRFTSSVSGSTFLCRLDNHSFRRCQSPFTAPRLGFGRHEFKVKARAPGGSTDTSPAAYTFRVLKPKRTRR